MAEKTTHLGRAGEFAALSEFLFRGYNVAIPSVDVGDDAFVIDDRDGTTWRVQVKTSDVVETKAGRRVATYNLSRAQLRAPKPFELYFMLMARWDDRWHYALISRAKLQDLRREFEKPRQTKKRGRKAVGEAEAKGDQVSLKLTWTNEEPTGWGASFKPHCDQWPSELPAITDGPGAKKPAASRSPDR